MTITRSTIVEGQSHGGWGTGGRVCVFLYRPQVITGTESVNGYLDIPVLSLLKTNPLQPYQLNSFVISNKFRRRVFKRPLKDKKYYKSETSFTISDKVQCSRVTCEILFLTQIYIYIHLFKREPHSILLSTLSLNKAPMRLFSIFLFRLFWRKCYNPVQHYKFFIF